MAGQKPIKLSFSLAFQVKYCRIMIGIFSGASLLLYLLMDEALAGSYLENLRTLYFLDQNLPLYLSIMALLQVFFVLVLTLVVNLLVSHQIAGPVFRYEDVLGKIANGKIPEQVSTRHSDQLKPVVVSLNELAGSFRDVFGRAQRLHEQLEVMDEKSPEQFVDQLESMRSEVAELRQSLGLFRGQGSTR